MASSNPTRPIEFAILDGNVRRVGIGSVVLGKCYVGPIRLGDRFSEATDVDGTKTEVDLEVDEIFMLDRLWSEVFVAYSAAIRLVGTGRASLALDTILRGHGSGAADSGALDGPLVDQ